MEDNSYVSLSLEKYNELYDKAKKFDELEKELGENIADKFNECFDNLFKIINSCNEAKEESAATEEFVDEIKVGDKVRILENDVNAPVGVVGTIVGINNVGILQIEDGENKNFVWVLPDKKYVEKINESEEK